MKCACPKCSALLLEDLSSIPEKGKSGKCSECGGSYWVHRESFMLRCYAVTGERYCGKCGEGLGQSTFCPGCGTLYPDYVVVHSKKPSQRAFERKEFSLSLTMPRFSAKSPGGGSTERLFGAGGKSKAGSSDLRRQLTMVGVAIALLAVVAVLAVLYMRDRAESKFAREFVVALYGVKSGTDQCLKKSSLLASGTRMAEKDLGQLKSVKAEIAEALLVLSHPPDKFIDAHNRLLTLEKTYEKLYTLCITSGPTADVAISAGTLEKQFISQAKELKAALPPPLLAELKVKVSRYGNLQFMLE